MVKLGEENMDGPVVILGGALLFFFSLAASLFQRRVKVDFLKSIKLLFSVCWIYFFPTNL